MKRAQRYPLLLTPQELAALHLAADIQRVDAAQLLRGLLAGAMSSLARKNGLPNVETAQLRNAAESLRGES